MLILWLVSALCALLWKLSRRPRSAREPPEYPGALPLLGHLHLVIMANTNNLLQILEKISRHCFRTDNATVLLLGTRSDYFVADPDDALTVANFCLRKNFMYKYARPWLGNGLITATVPVWKQHRKLLNPTFGLQVMHTYLDIFNRQARRLVGKVSMHAGRGTFDPQADIRQTSLETICMTAMGLDLTDESIINDKYTKAVNEMLGLLTQRYLIPWMYIDFIYQRSDLKKKQDKYIQTLHNVSTEIIQRWWIDKKKKLCAENSNDNYSGRKCKPFLELLLELSDEHGLFTDEEVKKHVDTIIASGYETVASVLLFTIVLIGSYPRVQDRLVQELSSLFGDSDRDVVAQDLTRLVYLEAVIKESMRVYTVVPVVARRIDTDVKLKNSTLMAGNTCYLSLHGIHRHPIWGDDAEEFRPERWLDPTTLPINVKAFIPFSLGRRNCIGKPYAMMSLKTTLVHFLRRYKVTADHKRIVLKLEFLLKSASGHEISIEQR